MGHGEVRWGPPPKTGEMPVMLTAQEINAFRKLARNYLLEGLLFDAEHDDAVQSGLNKLNKALS